MRVLFVVPSPEPNPGDAVIFAGVSRLVDEGVPVTTSACFYLEARSPETLERNRQVSLLEFDLLIVSGTPWLWDNCLGSPKYEELRYLLDRYRNSKKIAVGIGACLPFHCGKEMICADAKVSGALRDIWRQFDLITTRDQIAADILETCGVANHHEYCPSILSVGPDRNETRTRCKPGQGALVFYLPQVGISRESLPDDFVEDYVNMQLALATARNLKIACLTDPEAGYLAQRLKKQVSAVRVLGSADEIHSFVADKALVVTGRVHVAIPALMAGCRTCLLPVDSRYRTAAELGARILWRYGSCFPVLRIKPVPVRSLAREIRIGDFLGPVGMPMCRARPDRAVYLAKISALIRLTIASTSTGHHPGLIPAYE